jgi:diaminohydroxyphosphoribosylaminopyrimidine deaminase/5-amino-6-(5-phosphoribosylamino)uracil reductase
MSGNAVCVMRGNRAEDRKFMKIALRLGRKGLGYTEPNPMVGAVVVKKGRILGCGYHRAYGDRHAEVMALEHLDAPGATLYLNLEPCSHFGKTPPCVDLIIARKVRRVVIAMEDPNPLVDGRGIAKLRAHGIETLVGVGRDQAERLNRHYLKAMRSGTPYVALHAGASLDGKLTDDAGHSRWVTSEDGRRYSHSLRGEFSAILAGHGTILADDPQLNLREAGWEGKTLYRVVLDSENTLSRGLNVFRDQERFPLVIFSALDAAAMTKKVPLHFFVRRDAHGLVLAEVLAGLHELGIASLLVEGGGRVLNSFIRERLFDEAAFFISDKIIGGRRSVQVFASGVSRLEEALELVDCRWTEYSGGVMLRGMRKCSPA